MSKKKSITKKAAALLKAEPEVAAAKNTPEIILINVPDSKAEDKKGSFINEAEADAMLDYYTSFFQTADDSIKD